MHQLMERSQKAETQDFHRLKALDLLLCIYQQHPLKFPRKPCKVSNIDNLDVEWLSYSFNSEDALIRLYKALLNPKQNMEGVASRTGSSSEVRRRASSAERRSVSPVNHMGRTSDVLHDGGREDVRAGSHGDWTLFLFLFLAV